MLIALLAAGLGTAFGQSAPAPTAGPGAGTAGARNDTESESRLPLAPNSPETAAALARIHDYLQNESALGPRRFELLSLITAREMNLPYAWSTHEGAALQAGLAPSLIDVVRRNGSVAGLAADDALLIDFGRQLFRSRQVDSATFAALVERLGRQSTYDAIMVLTYHTMAGILQRAADRRPPSGWNPEDLPVIAGVGTPTGRPGDFVALGPRPPLASDVHDDGYYRLPLLKRGELDARGREIFDRLVGADVDTAPRGPVGMTLNSPEIAVPVQEINTALRVNGALDTRMSEIVIVATGREMNSQYQWIVHGAAAERAGAGRRVLDAIRDDGGLAGLDDRDAVAIAFVRELFREVTVRPETFAAAVDLFGTRGAVEIAALAGDYLMVTMMYNALGMRLRPDQEPSLPHRAGAPVGAEWR
jgi:4-carboxymuconolactone decarboxylase